MMTEPIADLEQLGDEIAELSAHLHAATYRLLVRLHEFDRREGWTGGFRSCAHWLSWRTGIDAGAARERVRVARALVHLPCIGEAMRRGVLSYAVVRALTRIATPENEAQLLELARQATAAQVEKLVRAWRRADRLEEEDRHESRRLTLYVDTDGSYVIRGRLDPETGALLERALDAATEPAEGADGPSPVQRRADALRRVAELALGSAPGSGRGDRFQVVVHVDAETLKESSTTGQSVAGRRHWRFRGNVAPHCVRLLARGHGARQPRQGARRGPKDAHSAGADPPCARAPRRRLPVPWLWSAGLRCASCAALGGWWRDPARESRQSLCIAPSNGARGRASRVRR